MTDVFQSKLLTDSLIIQSVPELDGIANTDANNFFVNTSTIHIGNTSVSVTITPNNVTTPSVFVGDAFQNTTITPTTLTILDITGANTYIDNFIASFPAEVIVGGSITITGDLAANGATGNTGQVLVSDGNGSIYWGDANNTAYLGGVAAAGYQTTAGLSANVATLTANNTLYLGGTAAAGYQTTAGLNANIAAYLPNYTGTVNATTINATTATFTGNVSVSSLIVTGNVEVIGANNLSISDNMIYLNANSTYSNPDLGFAGNYNDGTYHHAGFFRDHSSGVWKVFDNYGPEPDASQYIDQTNTTFHIANFQANVVYVGNTSVYSTVNTTNFTGTANNTLFVGSVSAANVVSNAQLSGNLASYATTSSLSSYQTTAGLAANVATLTSNNSTYLNGQPDTYYTNATNISSGTLAWARAPAGTVNTSGNFIIGGNLNFTASNTYFTTAIYAAGQVVINPSGDLVISNGAGIQANGTFGTAGQILYTDGSGNDYWGDPGTTIATANNALYLGGVAAAGYQTTAGLASNVATLTANNTSFVGSVSAANVVSNAQLSANLANYQTTAGLNANIAAYLPTYTGVVNASSLTLGTAVTVNSTGLYTGTTTDTTTGTGATIANDTLIFIGNNTINTSITAGSISVNGTAVVANSTGIFTTSTVNAASHTTGATGTGTGGISANVTTLLIGNNTINTTITSAGLTVNGTAVVANSSGVYTTGTINATSFTIGTTTTVNSTAVYVSNTTGNVTIGPYGVTITANGLGYLTMGNTTVNTVVNATSVYIANTTGNVIMSPYGITVAANGLGFYKLGNSTVNSTSNASGFFTTGTANASSLTVGTNFIANTTQLTITIPLSANGGTGSAGQVLTSNGATGAPYWATGGGGGFSNGQSISVNNFVITGAFTANSANGTAGQILTSNGSATYWSTLPSAVRQQFTGDGSTTIFTVTGGYSANNLDVFVNGVKVRNGTDVTVTNGSTFTFTLAPPNGSLIDVIGSAASGGGGFTNGQSISVNNFVITGAFTANSSNGTAGQVLTTNGSATYWSTVSIPMVVVTGTTQTATINNRYVLTNAAATTVTLPASPSAGDTLYIVVANGLATNIVARNGNKIMSTSEDLTLDVNYYSLGLMYVNSTLGWVII
jgi:hypothetical protein